MTTSVLVIGVTPVPGGNLPPNEVAAYFTFTASNGQNTFKVTPIKK